MFKDIPIYGISNEEDEMRKEAVEAPIQYLSFFDLDKVVGFKSCKENNDLAELNRILYENGIDVFKEYFIEKCIHRPRTSNTPYDGFRVVGTERTDRSWRMSGACSMEAYCYVEDESLKEELLGLNPDNYAIREEERVCGVDVDLYDEGDCV